MSNLKFSKVVGYSSEDPKFPASNLLSSKGKWKCRDEGEKQAWVILELDKLTSISHLDIGNFGSAFIEVQVGRMGMNAEEFSVLLPGSSFMGPEESRSSSTLTRVRMFSKDKLVKSVLEDQWNLVKVVCTQPFNKHTQYGLSFISVSGGEPHKTLDQPAAVEPVKLGAFKMKPEAKDDITAGSLFARKKSSEEDANSSVAAEMRSDKTLAYLALNQTKKENLKPKISEKPNRKIEVFPKRNILPGEIPDEIEEKEKNRKEKEEKGKDKKERRRSHDKESTVKQPAKQDKGPKEDNPRKYAAFEKLMEGVVFTISGFQNPLRGEIRQKAVKMGGLYKGDWDTRCTHLVCAFPNTPKYNQVKGKGKIVRKEWIEDSFSRRRRLNWKIYSLTSDPAEESEDEIYEATDLNSSSVPAPSAPSASSAASASSAPSAPSAPSSSRAATAARRSFNEDENTDDEIERIMAESREKEDQGGKVETEEEEKKEDENRKLKKQKNYHEDEDTDDENHGATQEHRKQKGSAYDEDTSDEDQNISTNEKKRMKKGSSEKKKRSDSSGKDKKEGSSEKEKRSDSSGKDKKEGSSEKEKRSDSSGKDKKEGTSEKGKKSKRSEKGRRSDSSGRTKELNRNGEKRMTDESPERKKAREDKENNSNQLNRQSRGGGHSSDEAYGAETDKEESDDEYNAETDVDEENLSEIKSRTDHISLDKFLPFFKEKIFYLLGFEENEYSLLERYIVAYGGTISMYNNASVRYIVTKSASSADIRGALKINPRVEVVAPGWVFKCVDKQDVVSTHKFRL